MKLWSFRISAILFCATCHPFAEVVILMCILIRNVSQLLRLYENWLSVDSFEIETWVSAGWLLSLQYQRPTTRGSLLYQSFVTSDSVQMIPNRVSMILPLQFWILLHQYEKHTTFHFNHIQIRTSFFTIFDVRFWKQKTKWNDNPRWLGSLNDINILATKIHENTISRCHLYQKYTVPESWAIYWSWTWIGFRYVNPIDWTGLVEQDPFHIASIQTNKPKKYSEYPYSSWALPPIQSTVYFDYKMKMDRAILAENGLNCMHTQSMTRVKNWRTSTLLSAACGIRQPLIRYLLASRQAKVKVHQFVARQFQSFRSVIGRFKTSTINSKITGSTCRVDAIKVNWQRKRDEHTYTPPMSNSQPNAWQRKCAQS